MARLHVHRAGARYCANCGADLTGRAQTATYCSAKCKEAAKQRRYQQRHKERLAAYKRDYRRRKALEKTTP